jgi:hypothetical protein
MLVMYALISSLVFVDPIDSGTWTYSFVMLVFYMSFASVFPFYVMNFCTHFFDLFNMKLYL